MLRGLLCAVAFAGACAPERASTAGPASVEQAIIGGTADTDDTSVVLIIALAPSGEGTLCTGTVVSPHVVATAAHCVAPSALTPQLGAQYQLLVFLGSDDNDPAQYNDASKFLDVASVEFDPGFTTAANGMPQHDVGAVITKKALTQAPVPINRQPLGAEQVGAPVRIIGFGRTYATSSATASARHQAATTLASIDSEHLLLQGVPAICEGDSGGPTLFTRHGVESLAGIHSFANSAHCNDQSFDVRVDVALPAFIDPLISRNDPGFVAPADDVDAGVIPDAGNEMTVDAGADVQPPGDEPMRGCSATGAPLPLLLAAAVVFAGRFGPRRWRTSARVSPG